MTATFPQKVPCADSYYSADMSLANAPGPRGLGLFPWAKVKLSFASCQGPHAFTTALFGVRMPQHWAKSSELSGALRGLEWGLVQPVVPVEMTWDHTSSECAWSSSTLPDRPPHLTSVTKIKSSCLFFQKVFKLYGL